MEGDSGEGDSGDRVDDSGDLDGDTGDLDGDTGDLDVDAGDRDGVSGDSDGDTGPSVTGIGVKMEPFDGSSDGAKDGIDDSSGCDGVTTGLCVAGASGATDELTGESVATGAPVDGDKVGAAVVLSSRQIRDEATPRHVPEQSGDPW